MSLHQKKVQNHKINTTNKNPQNIWPSSDTWDEEQRIEISFSKKLKDG
jgi:hypothetical protein